MKHLTYLSLLYYVCAFLTAFSLILGYDYKLFAGITLLSYLTFTLVLEHYNGE